MKNLEESEKLSILHDDVFNLDVEAIVNPTNTDLLLGAGIAGEIRKKGGTVIQEECLEKGNLNVGHAAVTSGGNLKALYIIHAATMKIGGFTTENNLRSAIKSVAVRIKDNKIKTVVFPPMGIGVGRFPERRCAEVMIEMILTVVVRVRCLEKAYIVIEDVDLCNLFEDTYAKLTGSGETTPESMAQDRE